MKNLDFATEELVYERCKQMEPKMRERALCALNSCGNRYTDDVIQDTYIKAIKIFLGANLMISEFKKQLMTLCEEVCFEYYWAEKKNYAKPRNGIAKGSLRENDELDTFLWEKSRDETGNAERRMIALEDISAIKQYKKKYLTYSNAKDFIATFRLRNKQEWDEYVKSGNKLINIPDEPDKVYKMFKSWEDWISVSYYSFEDCINWVRHNVNIKSKVEWQSDCSSFPVEVPIHPDEFYKDSGWTSWDYFLGYSNEVEQYLTYIEAQKWVENNLLKYQLTEDVWEEYASGFMPDLPQLPNNIPTKPDMFYKLLGWRSWFRWFGKQNYQRKLWPITYHECSRWVKQNIPLVSNPEQWKQFINGELHIKRPDYIPSNPEIIFRNIGWHGWHSFLNNNGRNKRYINEVFGCTMVRIKYKGEKIWVKPLSLFKDTITGRVITILCNQVAGSEITFKTSDIVSLNRLGESGSRKKIVNKYKFQV